MRAKPLKFSPEQITILNQVPTFAATGAAPDELAALAAPTPDVPPEAQVGKEAQAPAPGMTEESARDLAKWGWDFLFDSVADVAPVLVYPVEVREKAVLKTAPVLLKYQDKFPDWFTRWREEIELGLFVGGLVIGAVRAIRAAQAKAEKSKNDPAPPAAEKPAQAPAAAH